MIILTAHGTIPDAVHATQSGAFGFLTKPVDKQELLDHVQKALKVSGFAHVDEDWRADIVTRNQLMEDKLAQANMVAGTDARVLLTGESGTGKELLARAIHEASPRRNKPFVCDQLQRHGGKSAGVGALRPRKGRVPRRHPRAEGTVRDRRRRHAAARRGRRHADAPAGQAAAGAAGEPDPPGRRPSARCRSTSASSPPPTATCTSSWSAGQFREDLYYRLNVVHIEMPSLGRRREDIPLLVAHFLEQIAKETGHRKIYAPEAVELLATAEWPGNVRQLYNVVRQNVALSHGAIITAELVQQSLGGNPTRLPSFDEARDEFTRNYLSQILQITAGNVSQAARLAKRNRTDFYKLLSRHQLLPDDFKKT